MFSRNTGGLEEESLFFTLPQPNESPVPTLPPRLDVFALIILVGVAQGVLLGIFFVTGRRRNLANQCLGWLMLALSAMLAEVFLCYSNYMFGLLAWVDFSEPFNFVMGPLFFLFVFARLYRRRPRGWAWHLLPAGLWLVNSVSWLYQPVAFKYNNYLEAYHPELPPVTEPDLYLTEDLFGLRPYVNELTLASSLAYAILALVIIHRAYRSRGQSFWRSSAGQLEPLRNLALLFALVPVLIAVIKPQFEEDLGDHLLACYLTGMIYATSFLVMRGSDFFRDDPPPEAPVLPVPKKKYEKSALSKEVEDAVLSRLNRLLENEKPHLDRSLTLPKLAERLGTSPHHLSQLLNDRLGLTFFDWLATHRTAEARHLLSDPATAHFKVDEIAERVGYNSPSAFHTAFKRLTNQTPAQFRAKGSGQKV